MQLSSRYATQTLQAGLADAHLNADQPAALTEHASPPSYWLTRFMILRLLGAIYAIAFWVL